MKAKRGRGAKPSWSTERGIGYCRVRSANHGKSLGHLFTSLGPSLHEPAIVARCSWCWAKKV